MSSEGCGRAQRLWRTRPGVAHPAGTADTGRVSHGSSLLVSPLVSLIALALIVLICRWVFGTGRGIVPPVAPTHVDLGLLVPLAEVRTRADAEMLRELLAEAGIRAGVSQASQAVRVLVFDKDLERARQLVSTG